ncbi:MAG TPA: hypothetical protein VI756_09875, partial [Blastocatellia bacterium]
MKSYLIPAFWTCMTLIPTAIEAQTTLTPAPQSQAAPARAVPGSPPPSTNNATARAPLIEGQPIETLPPEKADDKPAFREQTRAPYHASAKFKVTTLIDNMPA